MDLVDRKERTSRFIVLMFHTDAQKEAYGIMWYMKSKAINKSAGDPGLRVRANNEWKGHKGCIQSQLQEKKCWRTSIHSLHQEQHWQDIRPRPKIQTMRTQTLLFFSSFSLSPFFYPFPLLLSSFLFHIFFSLSLSLFFSNTLSLFDPNHVTRRRLLYAADAVIPISSLIGITTYHSRYKYVFI